MRLSDDHSDGGCHIERSVVLQEEQLHLSTSTTSASGVQRMSSTCPMTVLYTSSAFWPSDSGRSWLVIAANGICLTNQVMLL